MEKKADMPGFKIQKRTSFFILILTLAFSAALIAAEDKNKEVPPGMELVLVKDNYKLLVPEGAKIRKEGAVFILENIDEYVARRFHDMEERIVRIEAEEDGLKKEIERLKNSLIKSQEAESFLENK